MTNTIKAKRARQIARTPSSAPQHESSAPANASEQVAPASATAPATEPATKPETKSARVVALLQREEGATLEELVAATGWLPHTTRAAMTGLKRKGHAVTGVKADGVRRYYTKASTSGAAVK
ncbi:DUF3489 domain-containing protein [Porphyrobacter sp. SLTP]|uniref:DUF3489 domain-containing protein n=1 Tax=Porphyrobacter sp. SLTP TaxID=2683266 RepID=UPI001411B5FE|nr:DUF3489 domain-containing protein [Porphyrobacter sp. SLTP]NBB25822.1 DUF3489 domain-containing protein [Porphyrobacter sp. SLTP]